MARREEPLHMMPQEVKDWIDRAGSIMKSQKTKIEDLQAQVKELKTYKKWAEKKILQADVDD